MHGGENSSNTPKDNTIVPTSPDAKGEAGYKEERRAFFKGLSTSFANFLSMKGGDGLKDLYKAFDDLQGDSFHKPEERAWVLITGSITQALIKTFQQFMGDQDLESQEAITLENAFKDLGWDIEHQEYAIDRDFLNDPSNIPQLEHIQEKLEQLLLDNGAEKVVAEELTANFRNEYLYSLSGLWGRKSDYFAKVADRLAPTPASQALEWVQFWAEYNQGLREDIKAKLFETDLTLEKAYIDLNAYCVNEDKKRVVFKLSQHVDDWLADTNVKSAARLISGGPGSGKSSFSKILADQYAKKQDWRVLQLPLSDIYIGKGITDSLKYHFGRDKVDFDMKTLFKDQKKTLIIFDGLDELSGKEDEVTAFVTSVYQELKERPFKSAHLRILLFGREQIVEKSKLLVKGEIIYLLPYIREEDDDDHDDFYIDPENLLEKDLRERWWQKCAPVLDIETDGCPEVFQTEITTQPILNILCALAYRDEPEMFTTEVNINTVYKQLIDKTLERIWADHAVKHHSMGELDTKKARAILEEIGLAAFNNGGRKAMGSDIDKRVEQRNASDPDLDILDKYDQLKGQKSTGFVAAFYFKGSADLSSKKSVEFVHRSFSDYLAAQGLIHWADIWSKEPDAFFQNWFDLCGNADLEENVLSFIGREWADRLQKETVTKNQLIDLKDRLTHCFHKTLLGDVPLENDDTLQMAIDRANRAETVLFCLIAKLAYLTQTRWDAGYSEFKRSRLFARWWQRVKGLEDPWASNIRSDNMPYISLLGINLRRCSLCDSDLDHATLAHSQLDEVDLNGANMSYTELRESTLSYSDLRGTDFTYAILKGVDLSGANLRYADLSNADLENAFYLENSPPIGLKDAIEDAAKSGSPAFNVDKIRVLKE